MNMPASSELTTNLGIVFGAIGDIGSELFAKQSIVAWGSESFDFDSWLHWVEEGLRLCWGEE